MKAHTVAVVSHDAAVRDSIRELVESAGLQAEILPSLRACLSAVGSGRRGCLVVDHGGDLGSPERQSEFAQCCATVPVILIVERGDVRSVVHAMRAGARDVMQQPYRDSNLLGSINEALKACAPVGS